MSHFDTLFTQIRAHLHREDVHASQQLETCLQDAFALDEQQCVDILCPYVNSHLQQRDITPIEIYFEHKNEQCNIHPVAQYVPELFRVEIYSNESDIPNHVMSELEPFWITYITTNLTESRVIAPEHNNLAPKIKSLYLFITCEQLLAHLQHPLHALEEFCFYEPLTPKEAIALNRAPLMKQLRLLTFCDSRQNDDILPDLSVNWDGMIDFGFEAGQANEGLAYLMAHNRLKNLLYFSLSGASLGPNAKQAIAHTDLSRVQTLWLSDCALGDEQSSQLLGQETTPFLHRAIFASNNLSDAFAEMISTIATSSYLRELDLADNELTQVGLAHIANWRGLRSVQKLRLNNNDITPSAFAILAQSPNITSLEHLTVDAIDPDIRHLFEAQHPHLIIEERT